MFSSNILQGNTCLEVQWNNEIFCPSALFWLSKLHSSESTQIGQSPCSMSAFLSFWLEIEPCPAFPPVSCWMSQLFTFSPNEGGAIANCQSGTDHSLAQFALFHIQCKSRCGVHRWSHCNPRPPPSCEARLTQTCHSNWKIKLFLSPGPVRVCLFQNWNFRPKNSCVNF